MTILTQIVLFCAAFPDNGIPFGRDMSEACMKRMDTCMLEQPVGREGNYWFEHCQRIEFDRAMGR